MLANTFIEPDGRVGLRRSGGCCGRVVLVENRGRQPFVDHASNDAFLDLQQLQCERPFLRISLNGDEMRRNWSRTVASGFLSSASA